eukprot:Lankesteria_metandrocarpae@DN3242_c0_g1_i2.p1
MVLLRVIKKEKMKQKQMRILMLGLDNAGKTTAVKCFTGEDVHSVSPTLGFSIKTLEHNGYTLNIWDVGGQKTIRCFWRNYFEETDGLIWLVDATDKLRLDDCKTELHNVLQDDRLAGASLLVMANKQDIRGAATAAEIREVLELDKIAMRNWHINPCSATTGEGLKPAVDWLVGDIANRIFLLG